jgi:hypothetical protein
MYSYASKTSLIALPHNEAEYKIAEGNKRNQSRTSTANFLWHLCSYTAQQQRVPEKCMFEYQFTLVKTPAVNFPLFST